MRATVLIGLCFAALVGAMAAFVAYAGAVDVLVVLSLIGLLILRQMLEARLSPLDRARVGLFLFFGGLAFVAIVVERVREILSA